MNKDKPPKISVVIPVLNAYQSLEKAIRSVLDQHYENVELIILDAGSTDGTLDVIKRFESSIYYWHSKPDGSSGHAINLGIQKATGELIAQLMADDWFEPETFHAIGRAFLANPDADVISCGGRIVRFDQDKNQYIPLAVYTSTKQLDLNYQNMCFGIPAMSSRFLAKSLIEKIGIMVAFDAHGKHHYSADRELLLRVTTYHKKHIIIDHLGHTYLAHPGSATFGKNQRITLRIFEEHMAVAKTYLAKQGLTKKQRSILRTWYNDQSIRFLLFKLLRHHYPSISIRNVIINGLQETKIYWLIALFSTPCKIIARKMHLFLLTLFKKHTIHDKAI